MDIGINEKDLRFFDQLAIEDRHEVCLWVGGMWATAYRTAQGGGRSFGRRLTGVSEKSRSALIEYVRGLSFTVTPKGDEIIVEW